MSLRGSKIGVIKGSVEGNLVGISGGDTGV